VPNWCFGDSFDLYTSTSDSIASYWDSGNPNSFNLQAGRFTGGQCIRNATTGLWLVKSSSFNDPIHHVIFALYQTAALGGTTLGMYFSLGDGATAQCSIVSRSDGAIVLTSGGPTGTTLATYTGAVTAQNVWFAFEFEVVINNTTGSFTARKNGNTSNDFTLGSLNTRGGTTNNYANRLTIGMNLSINIQQIDDVLWRSDSTTVPWVGDVRAYVRMPVSDATVQFAPNLPSVMQVGALITANPGGPPANTVWAMPLTPNFSGTVSTLITDFAVSITGHVNMALYDSSGPPSGAFTNGPGVFLRQTTQLTNPVAGPLTFTLTSPISLIKGTMYWVAMISDASLATAVYGNINQFNAALAFTYSGGAFPASMASYAQTAIHQGFQYLGWNIVPGNFGLVNETLQDASATYVYDSTPGDADFYTIATLAATPINIVAVTTRGFVEKSDAGARSGAVQLKSGSTTVASPTTVLSSSWNWLWRVDQTDPSTGTLWTASGVDAAQIGPKTVA
jgi:hypothetical protein